jgi:transglutaminase-like putative cysteine protease
MQPRSEGGQRCLSFRLTTSPSSKSHSYNDCYGNIVHHFNVPTPHRTLAITAESMVILSPPDPLPDAIGEEAWAALDVMIEAEDWWEFLAPSRFAMPSPLVESLADELGATRRADPLIVLRELNQRMYKAFGYDPEHTEVDSPIDLALAERKGVCQDFAHIMITLVRRLGIPCRYVSGYLFHRAQDHDRSEQDATHAWVEALLPGLGWVGFDPTNNLLASERHIRTAVGRDYADVPPTRGVFKGRAKSHLEVGVKVAPSEAPIPDDEVDPRPMGGAALPPELDGTLALLEAQQQQQQ